ncbi:MAG: hypothetical protein LBE79_02425 [Tannerella sp.]|nr:hypothetical protein [Tannerella sp.]
MNANVKKGIVVWLLIWEGAFIHTFSQEFLWKAGIYNFLENNEFAQSKVQIPQTMSGVHLTPEIGMKWDEIHRIVAGFDAMHEYGSNKFADYFNPIAYYELAGKSFRFYMGAFPRKSTLAKYPRIFFQDSIHNYRPTVQGIFWEYASHGDYFNVWLDWINRQTESKREAFFVGWSGRYNMNLFYGQHFGYMFHFANVKNPKIPRSLHDHILIWTSLGVDLSTKTHFERLEANIGWIAGMERDRSIGEWICPQGLLSEIKVGYKGLELFNTFYKGQSQQIFRNTLGNELYWGDPIYRTRAYDRLDLSVWFYRSNVVNLKMTWAVHFTEKTQYHSQLFSATFDFDNLKKKEQKKYPYIRDNRLK